MALFFGISPGEEKVSAGLRIRVFDDGERVWMHGKWLDLGDEHAVIVTEEPCRFVRPDGQVRPIGSFPAWVVRGKKRGLAIMTSIAQFRGGAVRIGKAEHPVPA